VSVRYRTYRCDRGQCVRRCLVECGKARTDSMPNARGEAVIDVCVYYFLRRGGPAGGEFLSKRRATLETIRGCGEPVMESGLLVDHTEIDANGFLTGRASDGAQPIDELWAQIRSLESRASSRDAEALTSGDHSDGDRKSRLHAESRELRDQARGLRERLAAIEIHTADDWPRESR
jgi:hypothetical protein